MNTSVKRACFNLGIGRELYTAPKIFVNLNDSELRTATNGKWQVSPKVSFIVTEIGYDNEKNINALIIVDGNGNERYRLGQKVKAESSNMSDTNEDIDIQLNGYALPAIEQAREQSELMRIWNDFPILQADQRFISALNARKKVIDKVA